VSKHDDRFANTFSVVIGTLVVVTLFLISLARSIGNPFEDAKAAADSAMNQQVAARTAPVGQVAVGGADNTALAIKSDDGAAPTALALPKNGEETYKAVCSACHAAGIAGAPKVGDKAAWAPRIAQGKATLYAHALNGFQGKAGVMPAKGARADLPDDLVKETVDYIVKMNQ
jgi:cytochrome c5